MLLDHLHIANFVCYVFNMALHVVIMSFPDIFFESMSGLLNGARYTKDRLLIVVFNKGKLFISFCFLLCFNCFLVRRGGVGYLIFAILVNISYNIFYFSLFYDFLKRIDKKEAPVDLDKKHPPVILVKESKPFDVLDEKSPSGSLVIV